VTVLLGLPEGYEWVVLLVVALLLFGGQRLAGMGKGAGRAIREFREEITGGSPGDGESVSTVAETADTEHATVDSTAAELPAAALDTDQVTDAHAVRA